MLINLSSWSVHKHFFSRERYVMDDRSEILTLFAQWNTVLLSGDAGQVSALYSEDAILLPTVSNKIRHNRVEIEDYFEHFLLKKPDGQIMQHNIRRYNDLAINSGIYYFTLKPAVGEVTVIKDRYTFVYRKMNGQWLIIEHHSSVFPEI